jgi:hypothetical protein
LSAEIRSRSPLHHRQGSLQVVHASSSLPVFASRPVVSSRCLFLLFPYLLASSFRRRLTPSAYAACQYASRSFTSELS